MIYAPQYKNTTLHLFGFQHIEFSVGKQHLFSAVWWGLENKDWSLLCILSWSLSLKWIRLTSTSRGFVCQEALSYSCSTMPLPQSKFSWIAGRESALQAGSRPYMEVQPTTKHNYIFSPLRNKKYSIYSPMTINDFTMSAGGWKACWSSHIDSLFSLVLSFDIQSSLCSSCFASTAVLKLPESYLSVTDVQFTCVTICEHKK